MTTAQQANDMDTPGAAPTPAAPSDAPNVMPRPVTPSDAIGIDLDVLDAIQRRVLWLSTRIVDSANHDRPADEVKVGGHQASSASLVTAMTALYFHHLDAADRVSVKPHASPVFHAIQYLLGNLDRAYLTTLRAHGGLQSYPSRTKDPDEVDFSTGSVGLGPVAPLFAAVVRRYVDAHFGERTPSRFVALLGDAELDEGNIWEAVADAATAGVGNVTWIVDFNRQSLDRVIPGIRIDRWRSAFEANGWHVVEVKYGRRLQSFFQRSGGELLRDWLDAMPNEQYQSLFGLRGAELRARLLENAPSSVPTLVQHLEDEDLRVLVTDLGGHDLGALAEALKACDAETTRPSVVFAYTVKGWGLPVAGDPRNHSALLSSEQIDVLRTRSGLDRDNEWDRFDDDTPEGGWVATRARRLKRPSRSSGLPLAVPAATSIKTGKPMSTQEAFGRVLVELSRNTDVARYLVTTAPDVATSTNLAGFINRMGVFTPTAQRAWHIDPMLKWAESPDGHHIELGISEMNLFMLLGQLGLAWDHSDQPLLPVGTLYDPFVCRGLDAFIYGTYSGSRFLLAGTPSGVTLAPEGGAHQSTITPSIGLELPGVTFMEPAYATAVDWLMCDAFKRMSQPAEGHPATSDDSPNDRGAYYMRLSTRPIDQAPFEAARKRLGDAVLREHVIRGAYRIRDAYASYPNLAATRAPLVQIAASGAVLPEALAAADELAEEGVAAHVVDVTSLDRLYSTWQQSLRRNHRNARSHARPSVLVDTFSQHVPLVSVHDAASHAMAWMGSAVGATAVPLGVDQFGQSGRVRDLFADHDLLPGSIVNAALAALSH